MSAVTSISYSSFRPTTTSSWCHIYYITSVILYIFSGYVTANEYYVTAAPNGVHCPTTDLPCHNLSYYVADYSSYFTDDTIFYFLEGTHFLQGTLEISGVSNIILQGLGHIGQSFHETVMQSTSVIMCSDDNKAAGIKFTNSRNILMKMLTIAKCRYHTNISDKKEIAGLVITEIVNITLEWVSVQNGSGFGLCLVNNYDVVIANSSFANNIGRGMLIYSYINGNSEFNNCTIYNNNAKQDGGGVSIILHGKDNIEFINCTIHNNRAWHTGGGVYIDLHGNGNIKFQHCTIYNNIAQQKQGGGVYISSENGRIKFNNCIIYNNTVRHAGGGGVWIFSLGYVNIDFCNCTIYINTAWKKGGGVHINSYGSGSIMITNCKIYNNTAYLGSGLFLYALRITSRTFFIFTNVSFHFNKVPNKNYVYQAAVVLVNIYDVIFNQIEVSNHNTTGLLGVNSVATFQKNNRFENNSGIYGGGIALYESSQLLLRNQTNVFFVNNHASESGGGIFVSQLLVEYVHTSCSFKVIPDNANAWLYFINNTAIVSGDVLYGGKIDNCRLDDLFHYHQQKGLSVVSSHPIRVCFCESDKPNCSILNRKITVIPGIDVNVLLATVGSEKGLTKGVIKLTSSDSSSNVQTDNNRLNAICTNVTFKLSVNPVFLNATNIYATLENSIIDPLQDHRAKVINVNIESCPIGFPLMNDTCVCRSELNTPPITCDINTQIITRDSNMWIGYKNNSDCLIVYQNCPFDYCNDNTIHFKFTSPNVQCLYNRSGLLCGECADGLSLMLGSNKCGVCTNHYLALTATFVFAGLCLCVILLILNLTVSVGSINGLLFYANMVKLNRSVLFSSGQIPVLSQFIAWLNLDLGIETCFFNGLDGYWKTWLQFAFSLSLITCLIICCQYSGRLSRLCGNNVVPVLSTLILMAHSKLLITIKNALMLSRVQCEHTVWNVWSVDGNIKYLHDEHIPLFVVSLIFLFFGFVYTGLILSSQWLQRYTGKYCRSSIDPFIVLKPFIDAYNGPYKDKSRFWTGLLLMIRLFVTGLFAVTTGIVPQVNNYVITIIVIILLPASRGIYKMKTNSALEMFFLFNLGFISLLNTVSNDKTFTYWVDLVSIGLSLIVFSGIVLAHIYMYIKRKCSSKMNIFKQRNQTNGDETLLQERLSESQTEQYSPAQTVLRRESLIFELELPEHHNDM